MRRLVSTLTTALLTATVAAGLAVVAPAAGAATTVWTTAADPAWAGVQNVSPEMGASRPFHEVSGTVTLPAATSTCGARSMAAIWVGLGHGVRWSQAGFTVTPSGAGAWYELWGATNPPPVDVTVPGLRRGDSVRVTLDYVAASRHLVITWSDLTRRTSTAVTVTGAAAYYQGNSAEWIVERPYGNQRPALARFGSLTWSAATAVTDRGASVSAGSGQVQPIRLANGPRSLASVATIHGSGFTTRWQACS